MYQDHKATITIYRRSRLVEGEIDLLYYNGFGGWHRY